MNSSLRMAGVFVAALACSAPAFAAERDGSHDFDFDFGVWKIHMSRLEKPLSGSKTWFQMDGTTTIRKIWDGRANVAEVEADGGGHPHLEILALRLYDPVAHEWSLNFSNSRVGTFGVPSVGKFENGRAVFMDQETYNGRTIWVRFIIGPTGPNSAHSEQAFSADQGKTWETNWVNDYTRIAEADARQAHP